MYVEKFSDPRKAPAKQVRRLLSSHIWAKEGLGFYVEEKWCPERLFDAETFDGAVWDPCCGIGRIADASHRAGYTTYATDIVDRGYQHFNGCADFLQCGRALADIVVANIVANPPFDLCDDFVRHALDLTRPGGKVAMIWLVRRLNAARWLADTPLARIYLLTPRPSMPPGQVILAGEKPRGGTQDFCWLVFDHEHRGPPTLHWLHRDGQPVQLVFPNIRAYCGPPTNARGMSTNNRNQGRKPAMNSQKTHPPVQGELHVDAGNGDSLVGPLVVPTVRGP